VRPASSRSAPRLYAAAVGLSLAVATFSAEASTGISPHSIGGPALGRPGVHVDGGQPPAISAKSWLVADLGTGDIIGAKNVHARLRPASTLKTLTALTLLPRLSKSTVYKASWKDAAALGSRVGIVPDATYTVDQLFYGMLLPSGNDAAHALADAAGGQARTVRLMAAQARRIRAMDTTVRNASGLDANGQYTSAYDLALIARAAFKRSDFRKYAGTVSTHFPGRPAKKGARRSGFMIYTQDPLLLEGYRGTVGGKTGYTTLAGRTFVGVARRGGHTLVVTMLGIGTWTDVSAKALLDWGFSHVDRGQPVGRLVPPKVSLRRPQSLAATTQVSSDAQLSAGDGSVTSVIVSTAVGLTAFAGWVAILWRRRVIRRRKMARLARRQARLAVQA
jgi:D-alanyl-D-alanine carboxypeptidase (penicillin-binding protein 5/6)